MEQLIDENNKIKIIEIAQNIENTVLFIGAGFTRGCLTEFGEQVLDGTELKSYFIEQILKKDDKKYKKNVLMEKEFSKVSDIYFELYKNEIGVIKEFFKKRFTRVILDEEKKHFLKLPWKAIVTLNVDDGIEEALGTNNIVLPNANVSLDIINDYQPIVIKIHGDVKKSILSGNEIEHNIVFGKLSYIKNVLERTKIYENVFLPLYKDFNVLFIGISLADEPDLDIFIGGNVKNLTKGVNKIYLVDQAPSLDIIDELKRYYGINKFFLLSNVYGNKSKEEKYLSFYNDIVNEFENFARSGDYYNAIKDNYFNKYSIQNLLSSDDENINYLLGKSIVRTEENKIIMPFFMVERLPSEFTDFNRYPLFIIYGKRFSGKTFFLVNLYNSIKNRRKIFIAQDENISFDKLEEIVKINSNIVIFLDGSSLEADKIVGLCEILRERNNNLILSVDEDDPLFYNIESKLSTGAVLHLDNKMSKDEIRKLNKNLDRAGIPRFAENSNIIQNVFRIIDQYEKMGSGEVFKESRVYDRIVKSIHLFSKMTENLKRQYLAIAILLFSEKRITTPMLINIINKLGVKNIEFNDIKEFFNYFVSIQHIRAYEEDKFSAKKIVSECDICLNYFVSQLIKRKEISKDFIANVIKDIVSISFETKSKLYKNLYGRLINFEVINSLFGEKNIGGDIKLIVKIYNELGSVLHENVDYWLQRAKAHYYLSSANIEYDEKIIIVKKGINFALKAFSDAQNQNKKKQARFTLALLHIKYAELLGYKNELENKKAVEIFLDCLQDPQNTSVNQDYIKRYIKNKKNSLIKLANNVSSNSLKSRFLTSILEYNR